MPASLAVLLAVVGECAGQLGIELARPVPRAVRSGDRGAVALESSCVEILHQVAAEYAPIGHRGVVPIVTAPAGKSVDEDVGVFRVELLFVNLYIRHIQHGEKEHDKRYDKRDDF